MYIRLTQQPESLSNLYLKSHSGNDVLSQSTNEWSSLLGNDSDTCSNLFSLSGRMKCRARPFHHILSISSYFMKHTGNWKNRQINRLLKQSLAAALQTWFKLAVSFSSSEAATVSDLTDVDWPWLTAVITGSSELGYCQRKGRSWGKWTLVRIRQRLVSE